MSLSSIKNTSAQEAASEANKVSLLTGKFDGAFTYFKVNEEKQNITFGFFLPEKATLKFQSFKIATLESEFTKWKDVDQNDTIWKAMKHISQTIKLFEILNVLGRLTPEGNIKGLRSAEGKSVIVNLGVSDNGYQQLTIAPTKKNVPYDASRTTIEGTPLFNTLLEKVPVNCVQWLVKKFEENSFVVVDPSVYDLEIATYKNTPAVPGKSPETDGFVFIASKDGNVHGRIYVRFRRNVAEDVQRLQNLASIIGYDEKKYRGFKFRGLLGVYEGRDGTEYNTFERAYALEGVEANETPQPDTETVTEVVEEETIDPLDTEFD